MGLGCIQMSILNTWKPFVEWSGTHFCGDHVVYLERKNHIFKGKEGNMKAFC